MKISVKNVKIAEFASEETLCFQATVYIDGKSAFSARNDGNGGCNLYDGDQAAVRAAELWSSKQPGAFGMDGFGDLDTQVGDAIDIFIAGREMKKLLKGIAYTDSGEIYTWKPPGKGRDRVLWEISVRAKIAKENPDAKILNDIPFEEAVGIYIRPEGAANASDDDDEGPCIGDFDENGDCLY